MYTCGPTVYNFAHIGNMRSYIFADLLKRYLSYKKYNVKQVMNITDVDDKIIRDSQKQGKSLKEFTTYYTKAFEEDTKKLNILAPNVLSKATDHIKDMVKLVEKLIKNKLAYEKNGNIYYKISNFKHYGQLAKLDSQQLKQNAEGRLNLSDEYEKDNIGDFALWKAWRKEDGPVSWETSIGRGRPGWHIECSAMSMKYLGESFDIHTGGIDLIFPHHTNEIAQSEGATKKRFVKNWMHHAHLKVEGKKMSKSEGNFYTIRDLEKKGYNLPLFRLIMLKTHYRQVLDFHFSQFEEAKAIATRFINLLISLDSAKNMKSGKPADKQVKEAIKKATEKFEASMDDDLNVSGALAALFEFVEEVNKKVNNITTQTRQKVKKMLYHADSVLGVIEPLYKEYQKRLKNVSQSREVKKLLEDRNTAREQKDFKTADQARDKLHKLGIEVKDQGTTSTIELIEKV